MSDLPQDDAAAAGDGSEDFDLGEIEDGAEPQVDGAEPEPQEPAQDGEDQRQPRSRARDTITTLRARAQEAERRNSEYEARLRALETQRAPAQPDPDAARRAEQEWLANLQNTADPITAALEISRRSEQRLAQQIALAELRGFDRADQAEFNALRRTDRFADRNAAEVERILAGRRQMGDTSLGRMDILDFLRGREIRTRGPAAAAQQRRQAAARVARQTTAPAGGGSNVAPAAGRTTDQDAADVELLRGITTNDV